MLKTLSSLDLVRFMVKVNVEVLVRSVSSSCQVYINAIVHDVEGKSEVDQPFIIHPASRSRR
jgi:hypothetical protein